MNDCPDTPIHFMLISIRRQRNGYWMVNEAHYHVDRMAACPDKEAFVALDAGEVLQVIEACTAIHLSDQLKFSFEQRDDGTDY